MLILVPVEMTLEARERREEMSWSGFWVGFGGGGSSLVTFPGGSSCGFGSIGEETGGGGGGGGGEGEDRAAAGGCIGHTILV